VNKLFSTTGFDVNNSVLTSTNGSEPDAIAVAAGVKKLWVIDRLTATGTNTGLEFDHQHVHPEGSFLWRRSRVLSRCWALASLVSVPRVAGRLDRAQALNQRLTLIKRPARKCGPFSWCARHGRTLLEAGRERARCPLCRRISSGNGFRHRPRRCALHAVVRVGRDGEIPRPARQSSTLALVVPAAGISSTCVNALGDCP